LSEKITAGHSALGSLAISFLVTSFQRPRMVYESHTGDVVKSV